MHECGLLPLHHTRGRGHNDQSHAGEWANIFHGMMCLLASKCVKVKRDGEGGEGLKTTAASHIGVAGESGIWKLEAHGTNAIATKLRSQLNTSMRNVDDINTYTHSQTHRSTITATSTYITTTKQKLTYT